MRENFREAMALDTSHFAPLYNLANLYNETRQPAKYCEYLTMAASRRNVVAQVLKELVVYYLTRGQIGRASKVIKESELLLQDSVFMTHVRARYPQVDSADN